MNETEIKQLLDTLSEFEASVALKKI